MCLLHLFKKWGRNRSENGSKHEKVGGSVTFLVVSWKSGFYRAQAAFSHKKTGQKFKTYFSRFRRALDRCFAI